MRMDFATPRMKQLYLWKTNLAFCDCDILYMNTLQELQLTLYNLNLLKIMVASCTQLRQLQNS